MTDIKEVSNNVNDPWSYDLDKAFGSSVGVELQ